MAFQFFASLTIDHTKVGTATQTDYPCFVTITNTNLKDTAHGGNVFNTNGYDILISTDSNYTDGTGAERLKRELETYNGTTGVVNMWIRVPLVSSTVDTTVYIYYGDPTTIADYSPHGAVWDSNYAGVYHFPDGTNLGLLDSTTNTINGTNSGATASVGVADGGLAAVATSSQYANFGTNFGNVTALTYEAWVNIPSTSTIEQEIIGKYINGFPAHGLELGISTSPSHLQANYGNQYGNQGGLIFGTAITIGSWYYCAFTYDNNVAKFYQNGTIGPTSTGADAISFSNVLGTDTIAFNIGRAPNAINYLTGTVDEVRISSSVRTQDYLQTVYNNIANPNTFYTLGTQQQITNKTITGKAAIRNTTTQTLSGQARIISGVFIGPVDSALGYRLSQPGSFALGYIELAGNLTQQTIIGKAAIRNTSTQTILGKANINLQQNKTITGKVRIQINSAQALPAIARIQQIVNKTILGKANIQVNVATQTILGKARITAISAKTITGLARILVTNINKIIIGKARIIIQPVVTPASNTFIVVPEVRNFIVFKDTNTFIVMPENRTYLV